MHTLLTDPSGVARVVNPETFRFRSTDRSFYVFRVSCSVARSCPPTPLAVGKSEEETKRSREYENNRREEILGEEENKGIET